MVTDTIQPPPAEIKEEEYSDPYLKKLHAAKIRSTKMRQDSESIASLERTIEAFRKFRDSLK